MSEEQFQGQVTPVDSQYWLIVFYFHFNYEAKGGHE